MPARGGTVRLQIPSNFELLDVIQVASDRIAVRQVETYSASGSEARPVLYRDGTFRMDAGPVEFKTRSAG